MGCIVSKDDSLNNITRLPSIKSKKSRSVKATNPVRITNALSSMIQLESHVSPKAIHMKGSNIEYDFNSYVVCRRGYYPNSPKKANQDSFLMHENVLQSADCHLFGIFDGHGETGDRCSHYCASKVCSLQFVSATVPPKLFFQMLVRPILRRRNRFPRRPQDFKRRKDTHRCIYAIIHTIKPRFAWVIRWWLLKWNNGNHCLYQRWPLVYW